MPIGTLRRHRERAREIAEQEQKEANEEGIVAAINTVGDLPEDETANVAEIEVETVETAETEADATSASDVTEVETEEATQTVLPDTFPGYEELSAAGYETYESLEGLTQDDLIAIDGIGKVTSSRILNALRNG